MRQSGERLHTEPGTECGDVIGHCVMMYLYDVHNKYKVKYNLNILQGVPKRVAAGAMVHRLNHQ